MLTKYSLRCLIIVGLASFSLAAQQEYPHSFGMQTPNIATDSNSEPALQHRNPRYELSYGDTLEVSFALTPEFDQTVVVEPDGYITLPAVGDLHIQGDTVPEATEAIRNAYLKLLHDPIVTIQLKDFQKPFFIAVGEVGHPGKYELRGDTTVIEAVAIAGGFTDASKHSQVFIFHRVSNDWAAVQKLDLKRMLNSRNLHEDTLLQPGDMVYVPKNMLMKISRYIPVSSLGTYYSAP